MTRLVLAVGQTQEDASYVHLAVPDHVRDIGQRSWLVGDLDLDPRSRVVRSDELYKGAASYQPR